MVSEIKSIFPCPVYHEERDLEFDTIEKKEIEDIINEGMRHNIANSTSINSYIFNDRLKNIKQFCEHSIEKYVKEIIVPKDELDVYITQSWLNVTKPKEQHHSHCHHNSIISGVFYISTEETDSISFYNPNQILMDQIKVEQKEYNLWNSLKWTFPVENNVIILFPSWLHHEVNPNQEATKDRISLSFNTYVRGKIGKDADLTELILK